jgi:hypothetical protein
MWVSACHKGVGELQMTPVAADKCVIPRENPERGDRSGRLAAAGQLSQWSAGRRRPDRVREPIPSVTFR